MLGDLFSQGDEEGNMLGTSEVGTGFVKVAFSTVLIASPMLNFVIPLLIWYVDEETFAATCFR